MKACFGFDSAILLIKAGARVKRLSWDRGTWLKLEANHYKTNIGNLPEIIRSNHDELGFSHPYTPSARDLLAEDWTAEYKEDLPYGN